MEWKSISRKKLSTGWVKVNVDGALAANPGNAGEGGVIRAELGAWRKGFCCNLGTASNIVAEFWGIIHGIELAWKEGYRKV